MKALYHLALVVILALLTPPRGLSQAVATDHQREWRRVKFEFVKVAPGEFTMGCSVGDGQCDDAEKPAHRVRITRAFEIGKYEVTQAMWESVMGSNPVTSKVLRTGQWNE